MIRRVLPQAHRAYAQGIRATRIKRRYSVIFEPQAEEVRIRVGASSYIHLNVHNAPPAGTPCEGPIILSLCNDDQEPPPRALLSSQNTVVTLYPRWQGTNRFPIPLHHTLAAYDWLTTNLCPAPLVNRSRGSLSMPKTSSSRLNSLKAPDDAEHQRSCHPIALFSTSYLSSIALSTALTESRINSGHRISAVAAKDGIFDYSILAREELPANADAATTAFWQLGTKSLFSGPGQTFDAFISPTAWFMSPGITIPSLWPGEKAVTPKTSPMPIFDEYGNEVIRDSMLGVRIEEMDLSGKPTRKGYTTFQNKGSHLKLPFTRLAVTTSIDPSSLSAAGASGKGKKSKKKVSELPGLESGSFEDLLLQQAVEMRRLMRRSIDLHEMKALELDGDADDAEERVTLVGLEGGRETDRDGVWAAEFFRNVL